MKWISAGDLKNWVISQPRRCQEILPELIKRLILAHTKDRVDRCEFLSGNSVSHRGWDGILRTSMTSRFFPIGDSGWEISVEKSPSKKADEDYQKRTSDPQGLSPQDTTFVFVTPHLWSDSIAWESQCHKNKIWKDILVIEQDSLVGWIEATPTVGSWLAHEIGKTSDDVRDLESVWDEWVLETKPPMNEDLVIGGRIDEMRKIQNWLNGEPNILEVEGDDPSEVKAFLYASIKNLPENNRIQAFSRCVLVETIVDMRQLIVAFQNDSLIIVAGGECIKLASLAVINKHHVLFIVDSRVRVTGKILRLSPLKIRAVNEMLKNLGVPAARAELLIHDSGHSLIVLRRLLSPLEVVITPAWAEAKFASILLPALFAGIWDQDRNGDRQVIEQLTGKDYQQYILELTPLLLVSDSPIRVSKSVWFVKSLRDSVPLLAPHLTSFNFETFKLVLRKVLLKIDPKYQLKPEDRLFAPVFGKENPESEYLRSGLARALVVFTLYGNQSLMPTSLQAIADEIVKGIYTTSDNWELWASLNNQTPILAEASPDGFLEAVEGLILRNPDIFRELMKDDSFILGECKHSGLLWALEAIAWDPEHFPRCVSILANLAKIDPGGNWNNRPVISLKNIFQPEFPQTKAKVQERLEVLGQLIKKDP